MLTESIHGLRWTLSACLCAALCAGCGGSSSKPADETSGKAQAAAAAPPVDPEPADRPEAIAAHTSDAGKIVPTAAVGNQAALRVPDPFLAPESAGVISTLEPEGADVTTATSSSSKRKSAEPAEDKSDLDSPELSTPPKAGTPDWFIYETTKLRLHPIAQDEEAEKSKTARKERNEKIVDYAQKAIAQVHDKPEKSRLFQIAVRHLLDARLQLALAGEKDHIEAMYDDAAALAKRDPQSQMAAEAARALVELAYINASKSTQKDDTLWLQEFAVLATHFASQFPREEPRAAPLLFTAAQSCENYGLTNEAKNCYAAILERFPNNKYAAKSTGILRRLSLPGRSPELSGTTLSGKQFDVSTLRGKPVLVVFWATNAQPCIEQMPLVITTAKKFTPNRLSVVGVNLDSEPGPVSEFLISNKIGWPQIFHAAEKSDEKDSPAVRWDHPIASKYGVSKIPSLWLIDRAGKVVSTSVTAEELEEHLAKLCEGPASSSTAEDSSPAPRKNTKARAAKARSADVN